MQIMQQITMQQQIKGQQQTRIIKINKVELELGFRVSMFTNPILLPVVS